MAKRSGRLLLTLRVSVLLWIAGAIAGWVVVVVAAYYTIRTGEPVIAGLPDIPPLIEPRETDTAPGGDDLRVSDEEMKALQEIAPAADPRETPAEGAPAQAPTE